VFDTSSRSSGTTTACSRRQRRHGPTGRHRDAVFEALEAGIKTIVIVTTHPRRDVAMMVELADQKGALIGPTASPDRPGVAKMGGIGGPRRTLRRLPARFGR